MLRQTLTIVLLALLLGGCGKQDPLAKWQARAAKIPLGSTKEQVAKKLPPVGVPSLGGLSPTMSQGDKVWWWVTDDICICATFAGSDSTLSEAVTVERSPIPEIEVTDSKADDQSTPQHAVSSHAVRQVDQTDPTADVSLVRNEELSLRAIGTKQPGQRLIAWTESGDILLLNEELQPIASRQPHKQPDAVASVSDALKDALFSAPDDVKLPKSVSSQDQWDKLTWPRAFRAQVIEHSDGKLLVVESTRKSGRYQAVIPCTYGSATGSVVVSYDGLSAASVHGSRLVIWSLPSCRAVAVYDFSEEEQPRLYTNLGGTPPRFVGLCGGTPFICTPDWTEISESINAMPIGAKEVMMPILGLSDFDAFTEKEAMVKLQLSQRREAALPIIKWCLSCREYGGRVPLVNMVPAVAGEETVPLLLQAINEDPNPMVVSRAITAIEQIARAGNMGSHIGAAAETCERNASKHWSAHVRNQAAECAAELKKKQQSRTNGSNTTR